MLAGTKGACSVSVQTLLTPIFGTVCLKLFASDSETEVLGPLGEHATCTWNGAVGGMIFELLIISFNIVSEPGIVTEVFPLLQTQVLSTVRVKCAAWPGMAANCPSG